MDIKKGIYAAERTADLIEIFVVEPDGSNISELVDWADCTLNATAVMLGGKSPSTNSGLALGVIYAKGAEIDAKNVVSVLGIQWGKEFFSFAGRNSKGRPTSVLYKTSTGQVYPADIADLEWRGYVITKGKR